MENKEKNMHIIIIIIRFVSPVWNCPRSENEATESNVEIENVMPAHRKHQENGEICGHSATTGSQTSATEAAAPGTTQKKSVNRLSENVLARTQIATE